MAHRPSCSVACGIFPDQDSNPCPLHWQADSQPLHHQGSPKSGFLSGLRFCYVFNAFEFLLLILKFSFPPFLPSFLLSRCFPSIMFMLPVYFLSPDPRCRRDGMEEGLAFGVQGKEERQVQAALLPSSLAGYFKLLPSSMEHWGDSTAVIASRTSQPVCWIFVLSSLPPVPPLPLWIYPVSHGQAARPPSLLSEMCPCDLKERPFP